MSDCLIHFTDEEYFQENFTVMTRLITNLQMVNCVCQALEVAQTQYGEDSKELIPIYQCLARAESSQGDPSSHERATNLLLQAHGISKSRYRQLNIFPSWASYKCPKEKV